MDEKALKELEQKMTEVVTGAVEKHVPGMLEKAVGEKLDAEVKRLGLDKIDAKHGMLGGEDTPAKTALEKKQRAASFIKGVFRKDMKILADLGIKMTEGTDSDGGFLVPSEVIGEVDRLVSNYGLIRKLSRKIPMKRDELTISNLGTAPSVYWPGEANNGTSSSPILRGVKLSAKTCVGLTPVTNELLADADANIVELLMELLAEEIAGEEDNQGLNGVGAPFTGIMNHSGVTVATADSGDVSAATIDLDDLQDIVANLKESALPGACWIMSRTVLAALQGIQQNSQSIMVIANNPNIMSLPYQEGILRPSAFILGFPVYTSDKMPAASAITTSTKYAIFGNFKHFYNGDRQDYTMDISKEATVGSLNAFQSNQSIVRLTRRVGLNFNQDAFVVGKTAAS